MLAFSCFPSSPRGCSVRAGRSRNRDASRNGDSRFPFEERKVFAVAVVAVTQITGRPPHLEWTGEARRGGKEMTDKTIDLDKRRGMAAQRETRLRRLHAEVREQRDALRARQDALEEQLVAAPAETWEEAAEKARYLLTLFAATMDARDPRRQKLIAAVLEDFSRLSGEDSDAPNDGA